jgi:hypothetical protein
MERPHNPVRAALDEALKDAEAAPEAPAQLGLGLEEPPGAGLEIDDEDIRTVDLLGLPAVAEKSELVRAQLSNAGKGRVRGPRNHKTEDWLRYLRSRYASPMEVLAQIYSAPIDELARELHCTRLDAMNQKRHAAEAAIGYWHPKLGAIELTPPGHPGGGPTTLMLEAPGAGGDIVEEASAALAQLGAMQAAATLQEVRGQDAMTMTAEPAAANGAGGRGAPRADMAQTDADGVPMLRAAADLGSAAGAATGHAGEAMRNGGEAMRNGGAGDRVEAAFERALNALGEIARGDPQRAARMRQRLAELAET